MKNKDQILLEDLYNKILLETELALNDTTDDSDVDVNRIVHDILNKITPYLFDFSGEEFKVKFKDVVEKIIEGLNERIQKI